MRPDCKVLLKSFESLSGIVSVFDEDFPEMLSSAYLLTGGYWAIDDYGEIIEVKKPRFTTVALLNAMIEITKRIRDGTTIEEIVNEKELCGDGEEI